MWLSNNTARPGGYEGRKEEKMKRYQAIRIEHNGRPTYGDKYETITGNYKCNDIVICGKEKYIVLFEME